MRVRIPPPVLQKKRETIPLFLMFSTMYGKPVFDVIVYTDLVAIFFGKLKIGGCPTAFSIPESKCSAVREMGNKPVHLFVSDRPGFLTKIVPVCLHDDRTEFSRSQCGWFRPLVRDFLTDFHGYENQGKSPHFRRNQY